MKLFRVHLITEENLLLLNDIPEIINESKIIGLNLEFQGGGWDYADRYCYHEWKGTADNDMAKKFFINHYGDSFHDIIIEDLHENNEGNGIQSTPAE